MGRLLVDQPPTFLHKRFGYTPIECPLGSNLSGLCCCLPHQRTSYLREGAKNPITVVLWIGPSPLSIRKVYSQSSNLSSPLTTHLSTPPISHCRTVSWLTPIVLAISRKETPETYIFWAFFVL